MRITGWTLFTAAMVTASCGSGGSRVSAARATEIDRDVRAFAVAVAHDIGKEGPSAWRRYFADSPAFFMVSEGRMVFPSSVAATAGIQDLGRSIKQIELQWGADLRVDPLASDLAMMAASYRELRTDAFGNRVDEAGYFTGVTEYKGGRWLFRNAHWSVLVPPPAGR